MKKISQIIRELSKGDIKTQLEDKLVLSRNFDGRHWNMQGGCFDGSYAYYAMNSGGDSAQSVTKIFKVDTKTWQVVKVSDEMYISHSNDMAYDPYNNRLIVSWCDIEPDKVGIVDPDTLTLTETKTIPQRHFSIAYSADKHMYVAGVSRTYDLALLDDDFCVQTVLPGVEGYVKQGLECDDSLIYFLHSAKTDNTIFVFNWDGSLVTRITVPYGAEGENLFVLGDKIICAFNDRQTDEAVISELSFS